MRTAYKAATVISWAVLAVSGQAFASPINLVGLSSGTISSGTNTVYSVNQATGAATSIIHLAGGEVASFVGIDFLGGVLYATDIFAGGHFPGAFGTIDLSTGTFTAINNQGGSNNWHALTANDSGNFFYTVDLNDSNNLKTVTPSGAITTIGPTNHQFTGLAYDNGTGTLYGVAQDFGVVDNLYSIDKTTGVASLIGATGIANSFAVDLALDPISGTLYLNDGDTKNLYTVNKSTGVTTLVGPNGVGGIDGLAFSDATPSVPEPTSLLLFGSGLAVYRIRRRLAAIRFH